MIELDGSIEKILAEVNSEDIGDDLDDDIVKKNKAKKNKNKKKKRKFEEAKMKPGNKTHKMLKKPEQAKLGIFQKNNY